MDIVKARLYVTTEQRYAFGNLFGEWMPLSHFNDTDGFKTAFRQLFAQESDPRMKLLAWEDIPTCLINGHAISAKIFKLIKEASALDRIKNRAFHTWLEMDAARVRACGSHEIIRLFHEAYQGYFQDKEDFGRHYARESLAISAPGFNYRQFSKQLFDRQFIHVDGFVFSK